MNNAEITLKGATNSNFKNKVNEFNVKIKFLYDIHNIVNCN
jgi:hypothetical protein